LAEDIGRSGAEHAMGRSLWASIAIGAIAAINVAPAAAKEFPFCIKGCNYGAGVGDCNFSTYQQCQAAASGRDDYCAANPYFNANAELRPAQRRRQ
jgi:hypothetical protein